MINSIRPQERKFFKRKIKYRSHEATVFHKQRECKVKGEVWRVPQPVN